ncbi:MAG: nucleotidyl transferase AbiEii/AbiGii toxin family protein [Holosporaceae bacterium]|nr:nucleotidyl transferase AbiEii/AbiGii toxin family protein [Holosporaceae bacterium]
MQLLVSVLPHIAKEDCFALKGGTAVNLFIRDMPRLSVDIDRNRVFEFNQPCHKSTMASSYYFS